MESTKFEWDRLERLRAPQSLSVALKHLGIQRIELTRRELRSDTERAWVSLPVWLKGSYPFYSRLLQHEVGAEILRRFEDELREEVYKLQETLVKSNQFGLSEIIVPLVVRGEKIGFLSISGIVTDSPLPGDVVLEEKLKILMLSEAERAKAVAEWRELPVFHADKRAIVIQMLELLAREVVQFFDEVMTQREREDSLHKHTFHQMVTANLTMKGLLKKIPSVASSSSSVLIHGEQGTGRELLAKLIHERSERKDKAFRSLHCSSVAENLLEAELLGYEKAAFIGAYSTKEGLFEVCRGGTLYLKEIGDLSLSMQLKILRLITDRTFSRLGSSEILSSDVRIICSTQRNLKKLVQMGAFREDLFYRLNVVELELPPLRARKEDIPLLAEHFLQGIMQLMHKEGLRWREEALARLSTHSFPGNVRELRNEVERIVAMKESHSFIEVADLSAKMLESVSPLEEIEKGKTLKELVDEYERRIIADSLQKYHWNKTRVAELFQITRQGLLKKITKHKLDKRSRV
jgi:transcriptional regulator with PAS, ATPase and Fis domain